MNDEYGIDAELDSSRSSDFSMDESLPHTTTKEKFDSSKGIQNLRGVLDEVPNYYKTDAEAVFTWEIEDIMALLGNDKVFGPKFDVGNDWVFNPLITSSKRQNNVCFSLYLEAHPKDDTINASGDWSCCAQFALDIWNPKDPSQHKINSTHFRYNPRVTDWGFINTLDNRNSGDSAMIDKHRLNVTVYVRTIHDFTGVLWHDFIDYDSKKATGYVGINNQGATCYLNSLLQSYYFTKKFRKKVYQIPTQDELSLDMPFEEYINEPKSVSLALQRIFYNLQTSDKPVDTMELTQSFGWNSADAFTQHDVQEMNRILMDKLESRMKNTDIEGCLNGIFVGKMKSFIRCVNVDYESSRIEDFWDIQLNVKGLKNIRESFENYVELELLDGENKYDAAGLGLQAAEKGVVFESFPPVLHLQLKRFEYDFEYDQLVKINDRHEFFDSIDLKPYIDKDAPEYDEDWEYNLHCVLVHQGDISMGHYYALIKPNNEDKWFRFDDDKVWRATESDVFEDSFGADQDTEKLKKMTRDEQHEFQLRRHTSAYMLVYIRTSKHSEILAEVEESDVPPHIPKQIAYETAEYARIRQEQEEMHLYANFRIYHEKGFGHFEGFDLGPNEDNRFTYLSELYDPESFPITFRLLKTDPFSKVYDVVIEKLGLDVDPQLLQFWVLSSRKNYAYRPYKAVEYNYAEKPSDDVTVDTVINEFKWAVAGTHHRTTRSVQLTLYLEDATKELKFVSNSIYGLKTDSKLPLEATKITPFADRFENYSRLAADAYTAKLEDNSKFLIFIKFFDLPNQTITGITHVAVSEENSLEYLTSLLNNLMGFPIKTALEYYEELGTNKIAPLSNSRTFYKSELGDGDIICFTKSDWGTLDTPDLEYHTPEELYNFLAYRVHFEVAPSQRVGEDEEEYVTKEDGESETPDEVDASDSFDMWFSILKDYKDLAQSIGEKIGVDPDYLRLFIIGRGNQMFPLKSASDLRRLLERVPKSQTLSLRYEKLSVTLDDFEHMTVCRVNWVGQGICREQRHEFSLPRSSTVGDLIDRLQSKIGFEDDEKDTIICYTMDSHHRFDTICDLNDSIDIEREFIVGNYPNYVEILSAKPSDILLVTGFQFFGQLANTHSLPFIFDLVEGELFQDTKERLHKLLGISDKEFNSMRVGLSDLTTVQYLDSPAKDNVQLFAMAQSASFDVCIDHPDRHQRRSQGYESSIRIRD